MAFNPHEILLKIRNGQTKDVGFEEKLIEDKNNFSNQKNLGNFNEKKNYFASASSSSSFKTNNNKEITNENTNIIYDREYIESLLKNISLLENKVNKLEIELENANSQVKMLQIEKNELENLLIKNEEIENESLNFRDKTEKNNIEITKNKEKNEKNPNSEYFSFNNNKKNNESDEENEFLKEENNEFQSYSGFNSNKFNSYKTPGFLKTQKLAEILQKNPQLPKPTITIKLSNDDIN